jgi:LysM repeat protein
MNIDNSKQNDPIRKLTQALFVSGAINIALVTFLFYFLIKDNTPHPYYELKPADQQEVQTPLASDQSNAEIIRNFRALPLEQLLIKLNNTQLVENGYMQRDLALAALIAFHHFDLSRALLGQPQPSQQRKIILGKNRKGDSVEAIVYPNLSENQIHAIIQFANTERWPLTSHGLFLQLRKKGNHPESTLTDAFFLTPDFIAVETLFNRSDVQVEKSELLKVLTQGSWEMLSTFTEQQRIAQDLTPARRQKFLLDYLTNGSKAAAYLMLKTDGAFAAKKLNDQHILEMLKLLDEKTPEAEQFTLTLLTNPRGDLVWQTAANRLYEYHGESKPNTNIHHTALTRFFPQSPEALAFLASVSSLAEAPAPPTPTPAPATSTPTPKAMATVNPANKSAPKTNPKAIVKPATTVLPSSSKSIATQSQPSQKSPSKQQNLKDSPTKSAIAKPTTPLSAPPKPILKKDKIYVVQDGDSLWKIANKFKVDVEVLKSYNRLQSDFLKPGSTLKIPS